MTLTAVLTVWLLAAAYFFLTPQQYVSRWAYIVPTSNSSSSVTLESIGQTSTTPSQPFGNIATSPKVIYREIATSDGVRQQAAVAMNMKPRSFGTPRVRLVDETSLLHFQITGRWPEEAQAKGHALMAAFERQLDQLRADEQERRARIVRENLKVYEANLDAARTRMIEFQRTSGLLSVDHYKDQTASAEVMRRRLSDHRTQIERLSAEQERLKERLGLDPESAAVGLRLASDPSFVRLSAAFAESTTALHENSRTFGPNHPAQVLARNKGESALAELKRIAMQHEVDETIDLQSLALMLNQSHQGELLKAIVANEAALNGRRSEAASLGEEIVRLEGEIGRLSADASRLEALRKDHLVAEAVLTSAMARLDTNRADLYSSYPLVQVLAEPDLPMDRTQPRLSYALGGGLIGTIFILLAWGAEWLRRRYSRARSKSG